MSFTNGPASHATASPNGVTASPRGVTALPHPGGGAAARWVGGSMPWARFGLIVNLLIPLALLAADAWGGRLGPDPVKTAIHTTGGMALICLLLSLCITPLRAMTGWVWLVQFRRSLGVFAFYYACLHLGIYITWDRQGNWSSAAYEITHRYYLTIGFICLLLLLPLWATSFSAAIRWLGGRNWKRLHRLAYAAAVLGCIHFYLQSKADKRWPEAFMAALAGLLLWRGAAWVKQRRSRFATAQSHGAGEAELARFWKGSMNVVGVRRETAAVRTIRLAAPHGPAVPFHFRAGQFVSLSVEIDGQRLSRSYTIASPPTRRQWLELTVKREEAGRMSRYLHEQLAAGQMVEIAGPGGRFGFEPAGQPPLLLIAGGVGITPLMSILRNLLDRNWKGRIDLIYSVRAEGDVIFAEELRGLAEEHPNLRVHLTYTRRPPAGWIGPHGRIDAALLGRLVGDLSDRVVRICGPDEMARAVRDQLIGAGVAAERIALESFTPGAGDAGQAELSEAPGGIVTFTRSGRTVAAGPGRSILETAESAGISIDNDCRSGICGRCRCRLLSGMVTMPLRDALSPAEEAEGYILACQARPLGDCTVEA